MSKKVKQPLHNESAAQQPASSHFEQVRWPNKSEQIAVFVFQFRSFSAYFPDAVTGDELVFLSNQV
jgi:hypothetical protein